MIARRSPALALPLAGLLVAACALTPSPSPPASRPPSAPSTAAPASGSSSQAGGVSPAPTPRTGNTLPGVATPSSSVSGAGLADTTLAIPADRASGAVATRRLPVALSGGVHFVAANAGTSDGAYLIGSVQRDGFPDAAGARGYAALYDVATGSVVRMAGLQTADSQVRSAAGDGEWFVWDTARRHARASAVANRPMAAPAGTTAASATCSRGRRSGAEPA